MNSQHLNQHDVDQLKGRLEDDMRLVTTRLQELAVQDPFADPEHANDNAANDREASEEEGHDRINAQVEELTSQKEAIEKALQKMKDGTYGICEITGEPIPKERLFAMPTATTIVLPQK